MTFNAMMAREWDKPSDFHPPVFHVAEPDDVDVWKCPQCNFMAQKVEDGWSILRSGDPQALHYYREVVGGFPGLIGIEEEA